VSGAARSVDPVAPLVWSDGQISEPEGWEPGQPWDSSLIADYEKHVAGARRDKRAIASGKLAVHAFVQYPTDLESTVENDRKMLEHAVAFVNKMHGGDAVFHARLDRDEAGKYGVDVFFAPKFVKKTGKGDKQKEETWISLTKFEKEEALRRDYDGGPRDRGRMFQDAWAEYLKNSFGLEWVKRGERKKFIGPDRLSPEQYKIKKEREALSRDIESVRRKQTRLEEEKNSLSKEIESLQKERKAFEQKNRLSDLKDEAFSLFFDGKIEEVRASKESSAELIWSQSAKNLGIDWNFSQKAGSLLSSVAKSLLPVYEYIKKFSLSVVERNAISHQIKSRRDGGMDF